jgi:hypothetical protein
MKITNIWIVLALFLTACHTETKFMKNDPNSLPDHWDRDRQLRGDSGEILAWTYGKGYKSQPTKYCFMFDTKKDSVGDIFYHFSSQRKTNGDNYWFPTAIHYAPPPRELNEPLVIGHWELHHEIFDHKPAPNEIKKLVIKWMVLDSYEKKKGVKSGLNKKVWKKYVDSTK